MVFLNGHIVPQEQAMISVLDRGFLYGDGLFETLRVLSGRPVQWKAHWDRFQQGLHVLKLHCPYSEAELIQAALELVRWNHIQEGVLRLTISRGCGRRGYSPMGATEPTVVLSTSVLQKSDLQLMPQWRLATTSVCLPRAHAASSVKTANKLAQVLARAEADAVGADEGILCSPEGWVVEATSGNLFWFRAQTLCSPPLSLGALPGIARETILKIAHEWGWATREEQVRPEEWIGCDGVFMTMSTFGVVEVVAVDGQDLQRSPLTEALWCRFQEVLSSEASEDPRSTQGGQQQ